MLKSVKQKIRLHKIKKDALLPRQPSATMEDVQRKLALYKSTEPQPSSSHQGMEVRYTT